jgi:hypothetical protein
MSGNNAHQQSISISSRHRGAQTVSFLLGLIIGFGSFWLWNKNDADLSDVTTSDTKDILVPTEEYNIATSEKEHNNITIVSQAAGNLVVITKVSVSHPTWVAIHEDVDGLPANILGAQLFNEGVHSGTVSLLRDTESGRKYYAILYQDNGDRMFDYVIDLPVEGVSGDVVSASFITTLEPISL